MDKQIKPLVYRIESWALGKLQELVKDYDRKAKKLGMQPLEFQIEQKSKETKEKTLTWIEVSFTGDPLRINGWEFIGTIQHSQPNNILRSVPEREIPESYRGIAPKCEHCVKTRSRKDTFVLKHEDGGHKQVGRNCLRDFLGQDPSMSLALLDAIHELSAGSDREHWTKATTVIEMLEMCAAITLHGGFSRETPSAAWEYIFPGPVLRKQIRDGEMPDYQTSKEGNELAQKALAWIQTAEPSNFISNLKAVAQLKIITKRESTLSGWILGAYLKAVEADKMKAFKLNERQAALEALRGSVHIGNIGERINMTLKFFAEIKLGANSFNGETMLYKFLTPEGNVVTWMTGNHLPVELNDTIVCKATVKQHRTYEGIAETAVSRLSLPKPKTVEIYSQTVNIEETK